MSNKLIPGKKVIVLLGVWLPLALLAGCQSTREQMLAEGYPAPFASGFEDGCGSGRQAAGVMGEFRKNVPVYLADRQYATGWDDGFRQCHANVNSDFQRQSGIPSDADRRWQHTKDQAWSRAIAH